MKAKSLNQAREIYLEHSLAWTVDKLRSQLHSSAKVALVRNSISWMCWLFFSSLCCLKKHYFYFKGRFSNHSTISWRKVKVLPLRTFRNLAITTFSFFFPMTVFDQMLICSHKKELEIYGIKGSEFNLNNAQKVIIFRWPVRR